jgi:hypothetical protein
MLVEGVVEAMPQFHLMVDQVDQVEVEMEQQAPVVLVKEQMD